MNFLGAMIHTHNTKRCYDVTYVDNSVIKYSPIQSIKHQYQTGSC